MNPQIQWLWSSSEKMVKKVTGIGIAVGLTLAGALSAAAVAADTPAVDEKPSASCIAIVTPLVQGVPGNASEAAGGLRDLIVSYLTGPSVKTVLLEAKLPSQASEEAKQKGCEPLLLVTLTRKAATHGFLNALGRGANTTSWQLPGGGSAASAAARAGAAGGLQAAATMAQSTKTKDEVSLEYRLLAADGQIQLGPRTERRTAKSDGEDLLTPVVAEVAKVIVARITAK
jgi:hypothetical protein